MFSWSKKHVCITCTVFICCHDLYSVVTMYIHTQQMVDTMANVEWKCKCLIKMYTIGSVQYKSIHTEHITSLSNDLSMVQHQSIEQVETCEIKWLKNTQKSPKNYWKNWRWFKEWWVPKHVQGIHRKRRMLPECLLSCNQTLLVHQDMTTKTTFYEKI